MSETALKSATVSRHNSHARGREKILAHLAMLGFAALIAGSFSFGGLAARQMDPMVLSFIRFVLAVAVMAGMAIFVYRQRVSWPQEPFRFVILGGLFSIYIVTMFIALEFTSPVSTGAVFTLMPLMSAGFAYLFMRQRTRPGVMVSLVIAALGATWVIFRGDLQAILSFNIGNGEIIYFFGVMAHGAYVPLIRKFQRQEHPLVFGFWVTVFCCFFLLWPALPQIGRIDYAAIPASVWWAILYLSVMTTAVTFLLMNYATARLPASKVMGYGYLTPTAVILLEGMLGHGWVGYSVMIGAVVTACGLLLMALLPD